MPTTEENLAMWDREWDWSQAGDEWSAPWGSTEALWWGALLPRIHRHFPARTVLEIAPGHGRFTQFLKSLCDQLIVVDLSAKCIDACRRRFRSANNIEYHVNDGCSLAMIPDGAIDFAFTFDSLVHAEADVLTAYLSQLKTKLTPSGVAFIHHSNIGRYARALSLTRAMPISVRRTLCQYGVLPSPNTGRAESVTAELVADTARRSGLCVHSQEAINWQSHAPRFLIDCLTVVGNVEQPFRRIENRQFMVEAQQWTALEPLYFSHQPR